MSPVVMRARAEANARLATRLRRDGEYDLAAHFDGKADALLDAIELAERAS